MSQRVLRVRALDVRYGATLAVDKVDFDVHAGAILTVLGHNGAGKSSCLRALAGLERYAAAEVDFLGTDLRRMPAHHIARARVRLVPEGRMLVPGLTVRETLASSAKLAAKGAEKATVGQRVERELDRFPSLRRRADQPAAALSGGEQQMLAIGRALITDPVLLMLDEPSMGLAPKVVEELATLFRGLRAAGMAILLVEQLPELGVEVADHVVVLERGRVALEMSGDEARAVHGRAEPVPV